MTDVQPIPVYRPPFLTDGGEFRGSLIESPANIFYQKVGEQGDSEPNAIPVAKCVRQSPSEPDRNAAV